MYIYILIIFLFESIRITITGEAQISLSERTGVIEIKVNCILDILCYVSGECAKISVA